MKLIELSHFLPIQVLVFFFYLIKNGINDPVTEDSLLIFNGKNRLQFYRYFTYCLVHAGYALSLRLFVQNLEPQKKLKNQNLTLTPHTTTKQMDAFVDEHHNSIAGRNTAGDGSWIGQGGSDLFGFGSDHLNE